MDGKVGAVAGWLWLLLQQGGGPGLLLEGGGPGLLLLLPVRQGSGSNASSGGMLLAPPAHTHTHTQAVSHRQAGRHSQ